MLLEKSRKDGFGLSAVGAGCVLVTIWRWKASAALFHGLRLHYSGYLFFTGDVLTLHFPVIRYAIATLYSNFSITVIKAEGFEGHGQWVTGKGDDKLVLKIEKFDAGKDLVTGEY